ncbi:MAG: hypothetical protein M2R45_02375 [Verrucomicrobia subdivision 3 bacterium]|nr:hypothetical protein [Limisphaerales bacterium]MCS1414926.1 hypothetical protein [Limisphaerales bacterium]
MEHTEEDSRADDRNFLWEHALDSNPLVPDPRDMFSFGHDAET